MFRARVTSSHVEPRADTLRFVSKNGGRTWQATDDDAHNPEWASGSGKPGRMVDPNAHAWRYVKAEHRQEFERQGIEVRNSPDGRVTYAYGCYVRVSENNGITWTQQEIDVPIKGFDCEFSRSRHRSSSRYQHDFVCCLRATNRQRPLLRIFCCCTAKMMVLAGISRPLPPIQKT